MWRVEIWKESELLEDAWEGVFTLRYVLPSSIFPLLAGLDPDGQTCFNRRQCRRLVTELRTLSGEQVHGLDDVNRLAEFVERNMRRVHRYAWFSHRLMKESRSQLDHGVFRSEFCP